MVNSNANKGLWELGVGSWDRSNRANKAMKNGERELLYMSIPLIHTTWKPWNSMHPTMYFFHEWFDAGISFKDTYLVYSRSFEMNR